MASAKTSQPSQEFQEVYEAHIKRGVLDRLFRRNQKKMGKPEKRDRTPSPKNRSDEANREEDPENHSETKIKPEKLHDECKSTYQNFPQSPPPAAEAAFRGPPRYNWIDVVSDCMMCWHSDHSLACASLARLDRKHPRQSRFRQHIDATRL